MKRVNRSTFLKVAGANAGALGFVPRAPGDPLRGPEIRAGQALSSDLPEVVVVGTGAFGGWTTLTCVKWAYR